MTALVQVGVHVVEAYANWSRWVARCGLCPAAMSFSHTPGRLRPGTPQWECELCGTVTEVIWPPEKMMADVERMLMLRPDPSTRNWLPGESIQDLMWENAAHGVLDQFKTPTPLDGSAETLMVIDDAGIRHDNLPMIKHRVRREIDA